MCLTVKMSLHKERYSCTENESPFLWLQPKPLTFEKDMLVYKFLLHPYNLDSDFRLTPVMHEEINFENGVATQEVDYFGYAEGNKVDYFGYAEDSYPVIEGGIHSSIYKYCDDASLRNFAVIPAGTEFYFGVANDFVSKKLIIFKSPKDFEKYQETHEVWKNEAVWTYFVCVNNGTPKDIAMEKAKKSVW